jgi:hypothetical protein
VPARGTSKTKVGALATTRLQTTAKRALRCGRGYSCSARERLKTPNSTKSFFIWSCSESNSRHRYLWDVDVPIFAIFRYIFVLQGFESTTLRIPLITRLPRVKSDGLFVPFSPRQNVQYVKSKSVRPYVPRLPQLVFPKRLSLFELVFRPRPTIIPLTGLPQSKSSSSFFFKPSHSTLSFAVTAHTLSGRPRLPVIYIP